MSALTNIQWRTNQCDPGSVLFFQRFDDGRDDAELIDRYLLASPFAALVTNKLLDGWTRLPAQTGIYVTHPDDYAEVVRRCCDLIYPLDPSAAVCVGVTGTNGKTTTVKYLEAILAAQGCRVLTIGTLGVSLNGTPRFETGFTSPPLIELRRLLHAERSHYDVVAMEVSSHALDQGRAHGISLRSAAWTNFTLDHLDYHHDEARYFAAKSRILDLLEPSGQLVTTSLEVAERLRSARPGAPIELLRAAEIDRTAVALKPFLALEHNRHNYTLAVALANRVLGATDGAHLGREDWRHLAAVPGRFECKVIGKRTLVIDFAHTPDALETILSAIRGAFPDAYILTLFGCGGGRDRGKRPLMGAAVARYSDHAIVTSDNPRFEDPRSIIADILTGMPQTGREVVVERPAAMTRLFEILSALPEQQPCVALIAGKGHERYLDIQGQKTPYSDQDQVALHMKRLGWRVSS
ncbi:Mur ligase family protein [Thiocapsa imhoffii]|nr:Mur ligase family protein [Thiocapsa imhoffii]